MSTVIVAWALLAALVTNGLVMVAVTAARSWSGWRPRRRGYRGPRVAVVRPVRGTDPDAAAKHRALLGQQYERFEVIFVVEGADDPGVPAVLEACRASGARGRLAVLGGPRPGPMSGKARNIIAGYRATDAEFVAFCDADLAPAPGDLDACMEKLRDSKIGAAFAYCLFEGIGATGRLAMLNHTVDGYAFLIGGAQLGRPRFMQGGLMVVRRAAVEAAGGIELVADAIGDDLRLGRRIQEAGYRLALADTLIKHRSGHEPLGTWAARYLRFLHCHRAEVPVGFWAQLLLNPIPMALAAFAASPSAATAALFAFATLGRIGATALADRWLLRRHGVSLGWWCWARVVGDLMHLGFCLASVLYPRVVWRGRRYRLDWRGRIVGADDLRPAPTGAG